MIMARRKPSPQLTLRRRYDFHIGEAIRASLAGSYDKASAHSATALSISRELYLKSGDHRPELAAALTCHASSSAAYGRIGDALELLTESAGHYAVLAAANPEAYEVRRIDVLTRVALASDAAGNTEGSIVLLREVIEMYGRAPAAAQAERDFGRARARFHLGKCLLKTGGPNAALAELDAGLADAERASAWLSQASADDGSWLITAPRFVQLTVPDWAAAAARAMALHAAARHWRSAARAARIAVRLSADLAALGGESQRESYAAIRARADAIWTRARQEQFLRASAGAPEGALRLPVLDEPLARGLHLGLGGRAVNPLDAFHRLTGLQVLVDLEEVLDLQPFEFGNVVDVTQVFHARVASGHAQDFGVITLFIDHLEHSDDARRDQAAGESRLLQQHKGVQRIAVTAERVLDKPVVSGVPRRGEQHTVEPDAAAVVVDLVLVSLTLGDLDDDLNVHAFTPCVSC
jgi:hypothetical protein